jgi:hypothetical protein
MVSKLPFLPDEFHFAIASVAARAAQLDHHIEQAISQALMDRCQTSRFLLSNVSPDRLVDLLRCLLVDVLPLEEVHIKSLFEKIKQARQSRNEIMHWLWAQTDDPNRITMARIRPHEATKTVKKTVAQIQSIADSMLDAVGGLIDIGKKVEVLQEQTWRDKSELLTLRQRLASTSEPNPSSLFGLLGHLPPPSRE